MKTDDVLKALRQCAAGGSCRHCPLEEEVGCRPKLMDFAVETIGRQKTEIESLQKRIVNWREDMDYHPENVRDEAIREFAERLKRRHLRLRSRFGVVRCCLSENDIDRLVKEMTGDQK